MNNTLDNGFEQNFNAAMKMSLEEYDYESLLGFLRCGKIPERQIAALKLNEIKSIEDAKILVSNLTGQDGKVREAVSFKINELVKNTDYMPVFLDEKIFEILIQGIMDINGNVCRQIIEVISNLKQNSCFRDYISKKLPESTKKILKKTAKLSSKDKQYVISKRNFQLYWCLEALYDFVEHIDYKILKEIILKTAEFENYTIREKTAKILTKIDSPEFKELKQKLKNDENYYVKRLL
ncbi:MAG: hypothetical protein PHC64_05485 [Candidatus Gastranaerophilales bacterium]|nr:hypothetical protein [Candidatus Gastranaerophilales bacterium]